MNYCIDAEIIGVQGNVGDIKLREEKCHDGIEGMRGPKSRLILNTFAIQTTYSNEKVLKTRLLCNI